VQALRQVQAAKAVQVEAMEHQVLVVLQVLLVQAVLEELRDHLVHPVQAAKMEIYIKLHRPLV
jgi:hypothetical protein